MSSELLEGIEFFKESKSFDVCHTGPIFGGGGHKGIMITPHVVRKYSSTGEIVERHRIEVYDGSTRFDITLEGKDILSPKALRKWADELEKFYEVKEEK